MDASPAAGPTTRIRLFLRASNLPKSLTAQGLRQPDTLARVSLVTPHHDTAVPVATQEDDGEQQKDGLPAVDGSDENVCSEPSGHPHYDQILDETEVGFTRTHALK